MRERRAHLHSQRCLEEGAYTETERVEGGVAAGERLASLLEFVREYPVEAYGGRSELRACVLGSGSHDVVVVVVVERQEGYVSETEEEEGKGRAGSEECSAMEEGACRSIGASGRR